MIAGFYLHFRVTIQCGCGVYHIIFLVRLHPGQGSVIAYANQQFCPPSLFEKADSVRAIFLGSEIQYLKVKIHPFTLLNEVMNVASHNGLEFCAAGQRY